MLTYPYDTDAPETVLLVRLVQQAWDNGWRRHGLPPPPRTYEQAAYIAALIRQRPRRPDQAVLTAWLQSYGAASCAAAGLLNHTEPVHWLRCGAGFWANQASPWPLLGPKPEQDSDQKPTREFTVNLTAFALHQGFHDEAAQAAANQDQIIRETARTLVSSYPTDPALAVVNAYFKARGQVLAGRLGLNPSQEPLRFRQAAVQSWLYQIENLRN